MIKKIVVDDGKLYLVYFIDRDAVADDNGIVVTS